MARTRIIKPETPKNRWDRAELAPTPGRQIVYRMLDAGLKLLYVGVTSNPTERWRIHAQKKSWWPRVAYIYSIEVPKRHLALELELDAIHNDSPIFNINGVVRGGLVQG